MFIEALKWCLIGIATASIISVTEKIINWINVRFPVPVRIQWQSKTSSTTNEFLKILVLCISITLLFLMGLGCLLMIKYGRQDNVTLDVLLLLLSTAATTFVIAKKSLRHRGRVRPLH